MSRHVNRQITVTVDALTDPPIITVSDNPHIPARSIGTITWVVGNQGDAFTFSEFSWCEDKSFLHKPITENHVIVTAVNNQDAYNAGDWGYRICVKTSDGKHHWSMQCRDIPNRAKQEALSVSAALASGPVIINDGV